MRPELEPVMAHLRAMLPGMPDADLPRFAGSLSVDEPYAPGPDAQPRDGVQRGTLSEHICAPGRIYPGVAHGYQALSPGATAHYLVSAYYEPTAEGGCRHDDRAFGRQCLGVAGGSPGVDGPVARRPALG